MNPPAIAAQISRRRFLARTSAAGATVLGFPAILRSQAPNRRLNLAIIGPHERKSTLEKLLVL